MHTPLFKMHISSNLFLLFSDLTSVWLVFRFESWFFNMLILPWCRKLSVLCDFSEESGWSNEESVIMDDSDSELS
jgi:hypothetical protein